MQFQTTKTTNVDSAFEDIHKRYCFVRALEPLSPDFMIETWAYIDPHLTISSSRTQGFRVNTAGDEHVCISLPSGASMQTRAANGAASTSNGKHVLVTAGPVECQFGPGEFSTFALDAKWFSELAKDLGATRGTAFEPGGFAFATTTPMGSRLAQVLNIVCDTVRSRAGTKVAALRGRTIAELFVWEYCQFKAAFQEESSLAPYHVRKCKEFIRDNVGEIVSLGQVAQEMGLSLRSLQLAFKKYENMRPSDFLRGCHLDLARSRLEKADRTDNVTQIAFESGFASLSTFARGYRLQYGETPSTTLRRAQITRE